MVMDEIVGLSSTSIVVGSCIGLWFYTLSALRLLHFLDFFDVFTLLMIFVLSINSTSVISVECFVLLESLVDVEYF